MTHASIPAEERAKLGLSDTLVRLSPGCEHHRDLVADLEQGLSRAGAGRQAVAAIVIPAKAEVAALRQARRILSRSRALACSAPGAAGCTFATVRPSRHGRFSRSCGKIPWYQRLTKFGAPPLLAGILMVLTVSVPIPANPHPEAYLTHATNLRGRKVPAGRKSAVLGQGRHLRNVRAGRPRPSVSAVGSGPPRLRRDGARGRQHGPGLHAALAARCWTMRPRGGSPGDGRPAVDAARGVPRRSLAWPRASAATSPSRSVRSPITRRC